MSGYTEIIQVIGAMIIFSLILLSTNRHILSNTERQVESEVEMLCVTLAQDLIDEARLKAFDDTTKNGAIPIHVPGDFEASPFSGSTASCDDPNIDTFSKYDKCEEDINTNLGNFNMLVTVHYADSTQYEETSSKTRHKRMIVTIENPYLTNPIQVQYLRTYNHD
ncbi:MAG: hypothetical protein WD035_01710 [Balneolaceae bacterium]